MKHEGGWIQEQKLIQEGDWILQETKGLDTGKGRILEMAGYRKGLDTRKG